MFSLLSYAKQYKKELILGPVFKLLEAVLELLLPLYMARLINQGIQGNNTQALFVTGGKMMLMSIIGLVCVLICQYYASIASQGFGTELRTATMTKIYTFSHKEIDTFGTATLITRVTNDVSQLQLALAMFIRLVIRAPFLSIGSLVMAYLIQPKLTLIFVFTLPVFSVILYLIMTRTSPIYLAVQQQIDQLNLTIQENLSGVRVIRAFSKQVSQEKEVADVSNSLARTYINVTSWSALLNPLTLLIMNASIMGILYFGGIQVNIGNLQAGDVFALITYMTQMLLALIVVSNLVIIFTKASVSASRIQEILDVEPSIMTESRQNSSPWEQPNLIQFSDVSFKYTQESGYALKNISFLLEKHHTLGITGPTGSGKSTLIQLIPKFYLPSKGNLLVNNTDITTLSTGELRKNIAIVPQKSQLFSGTIRSNLALGMSNVPSDEDCWAALSIAQCTDFVQQLPEQLDAPVLAGGNNFSGGQKQRLTIARALMRQPELLILDDSLSALDYKTDLAIRTALKETLTQTTLIIISQRLSSIQDADDILVLDEGSCVGLGQHQELLATSPVYYDLAHSQGLIKEALE